MTDLFNNPTASSKMPSHIAYHIRNDKNGLKAYWTRIGIAWQHRDGRGFNIQIDTLPRDGRMGSEFSQVRPNSSTSTGGPRWLAHMAN